ncbi:MAG: DUF2721 domain-containing protein [Rhizobiales bacterium]|nr:DUF2721 domain-containing protein [Hyphomicrobiales bacterium]
MFDTLSPDRLSQAITHAIAPAFVLGAVAGFTSILSGRLETIMARLRALNALPDTHAKAHLKADIPRLKRRAKLTNQSILFAVISGVIVAGLLLVAFASVYLGIEHIYGAAVMFMLALLYLTAALITFAFEVRIALSEYDQHDPSHD